MNHEFLDALEQVEREKGISKEILLDAIETALASAYKRDQKAAQSVEVRVDQDTGAFHVYTHKTVVEEVEDDKNEITLEDAHKVNIIYELGDLVEFEIFPRDFGRIAAQTAKQVVVQRIREAERSIMYNEFANRVGDLITGVVQRFEQRNIFVDLGRIEGILPSNEQMPNERYEQGMRIKTFVVEVKKTTKGPQVLLSRTRTGLLKRLFELEVPEIQEGLVEIKSVAREPGYRSKIAVHSRDPQIDPVGACVGTRGIRVQMIVRELKGEKIDVAAWSSDPIDFIINALSPAKVSEVKILPTKKTAIVIVPDFQLSLAIGKEGQNARLAAKLSGWKIDIKSQTQADQHAEEIDQLVREEMGFREIVKPRAELPKVEAESVAAVVPPEETVEEITEKTVTEAYELAPTVVSDQDVLEKAEIEESQEIEDTSETEEIEESEEAEELEAKEDDETELLDELEESEPGIEDETLEDEDDEDDEDEDEDEDEELPVKKKVKKSKSVPKHLSRIDIDEGPIDEGGYFFDILEERQAGKTVKEQKPPVPVAAVNEIEPAGYVDESNGFTIGQLLSREMEKSQKKEQSRAAEPKRGTNRTK